MDVCAAVSGNWIIWVGRMGRKSGKIALYEAIGKSRGKLIDGHKPIALKESGETGTNKHYKVIGIVVLLGIALGAVLVLMTFANDEEKADSAMQLTASSEENNASSGLLGKLGLKKQDEVADEPIKPIKYEPIRPVEPTKVDKKDDFDSSLKDVAKEYSPAKTGSNVIVITRYMVKNDLVPVQNYFKKHGIDLEITQNGKNYLLITTKRYTGGFARVGSEAYNDLKTIKKVGAGYKAPPEFEPFGSKPFQDVYGMKLK